MYRWYKQHSSTITKSFKFIVTALILFFIFLITLKHPGSWQTISALIVLLALWLTYSYHLFSVIRIGKESIEIQGRAQRAIDSNYSMMFWILSEQHLQAIPTSMYMTPPRLAPFTNLIKEAKKANFEFKNDPSFVKTNKMIRKQIASTLYENAKRIVSEQVSIEQQLQNYENTIEKAFIESNITVLRTIETELVKKTKGSLKLKVIFDEAINDLKQLDSAL